MRIALIAHNKMKPELTEFIKKYETLFQKHELHSTGTTGKVLMEATDLVISRKKSGPHGGDQEIGAMIANGLIDRVFFFRDPLTAQAHEPDISALLRLADVYKIGVATNVTTAKLLINDL